MSVSYTIFRKDDGQLTKSIYRDDGGDIVKDASPCFMALGEAETVTTDFQGFHQFLLAANDSSAPVNVAIGQGICDRGRAQIASRSLLAKYPGTIPRIKGLFRYPDGEAEWLIDYDPSKDGDSLSREGLLRILGSVIPGFDRVEMIITASTSSGIYRIDPVEDDFDTVETTDETGEPCIRKVQKPAIDAGGLHLYIRVKSGTDIPRATKALFKRLVLAGYGRIDVSKVGAMLERTLIDAAVSSPERLDFCARPVLGEGLRQYRCDPEHRLGMALDTALIADLTEGEEARYLELVEAAKEKARPEAEALGRKFKERRKRELIDRGVPERQAEETIERAYSERRSLTGAFPLRFREHETVTAADVLRDPMKFDGSDMLDPWEPDSETRWRARLYVNDGRIVIHSFDAGGVNYFVERTEIQVHTGELHKTVSALQTVLGAENTPYLYRRGDVVKVDRANRTQDGEGPLTVVTKPALAHAVAYLAVAKKCKPEKNGPGKWVTGEFPDRVLDAFLDVADLPYLKAVVSHPIQLEDGRILDQEGYDRESGLFLDFRGIHFPPIPRAPTKQDAERSRDVLVGLVSSFPYVEECDQSALLAMLITGVIRPTLRCAPMTTITATTPGTGKTELPAGVLQIVTGQETSGIPYPDDEDEMRKMLLSVFREGREVILFDNIPAGERFESAVLCQALTLPRFSARVLGGNAMGNLPTSVLMLATGNNIRPGGDLTRRSTLVRLDARCERPELRCFDRDFVQDCRERRGELIRHCLTILAAHHVAGVPQCGLTPLGSFGDWSRRVRAALVWVGLADPCDTMKESRDEDPTLQLLGGLLVAWRGVYGEKSATTGQAVKDCGGLNLPPNQTLLGDVMREIAGDSRGVINSRRLGEFLRAYRGRIVNGLKFERDGVLHHAVRWNVVAEGGS